MLKYMKYSWTNK